MLYLQNHLPIMRNSGKLVANCGTKSSTSRSYGKLLAEKFMVPTMRNYAILAKSSTYYEKLW